MFDGARPGELVESAPPASLSATLRSSFRPPPSRPPAPAYAPRLIGPEEITDKQRSNIGAATSIAATTRVYQHAHSNSASKNIASSCGLPSRPSLYICRSAKPAVRPLRRPHYVPPLRSLRRKSKEIYELHRALELLSRTLFSTHRRYPRILNDICTSPMSHASACRNRALRPKNAPSEIAATFCPSPPSPPWCTPSRIVLHASGARAPRRTPGSRAVHR